MRAGTVGLVALIMLVLQSAVVPATEVVPNLYIGRTITTGISEEHRPAALARCFIDVLVKASGDPGLATDRSALAMAEHAAGFVNSFRYRDRLEGRPIHDEQGTRDRPHDLTVEFEPNLIDGALRSLGSRPWGAERPRVLLVVFVRFGEVAYVLTRDEPRGEYQREALQAASEQIGLPIILPKGVDLPGVRVPKDHPITLSFGEAQDLANASGADRVVTGSMVFSNEALGWLAEWRLHEPAATVQWKSTGVNYDEAFRVVVRGSAQVLSGNGRPD